ncbi:MAG TPA: hypothetical protein VGB55_14225 [Tepidisphaeraceae bacterium]
MQIIGIAMDVDWCEPRRPMFAVDLLPPRGWFQICVSRSTSAMSLSRTIGLDGEGQ